MSELPRFKLSQRGAFGLSNWSLLSRPGESLLGTQERIEPAGALQQEPLGPSFNTSVSQRKEIVNNPSASISNGQPLEKPFSSNTIVTNGDAAKGDSKKPPSAPSIGQRLVAKFSYNANVDSPLGKNAELSLRTMDKMTMMGPHKQQEYWWLVKMDDGREGYVPANYVTPFEEKVTSLPWLANKCVEPLPEAPSKGEYHSHFANEVVTVLIESLPESPSKEKSNYKPYKSAYAKDDVSSTADQRWFCEVCQKGFNGPQPYNAHMASRAHRDELEAQAAY